MVNLRSRRLEMMLGAPLDQLNAQHVRALPENGVTEDVDLDFKRDTYGKAEKSTRELAKDVAAFANTAGGVIVIGVAEAQGRAASTPGTDITDSEVRRLRQLIATGVAPLPTVDILPIPDPALGQDRGYLLVAVPRSPAAPHAVQKDDGLRYPRRHGTTTHYLSEPEVATAYRNRLQGLTDQQARLDQVDRDAGTRLTRATDPWVLVSLVPDLLGHLPLNLLTHGELHTALFGQAATIVHTGIRFMRVTVGQRCFIADDARLTTAATAERVLLQLHTDGSGVYAHRLHDLAQRRGAQRGPTHMLLQEELAMGVLSGLHHLGIHARDRAHAGGTALLRVTLLAADDDRRCEIGEVDFSGLTGTRTVTLPLQTAAISAALDELADPGAGLISAAAMLGNDIVQAFGRTELEQFDVDGTLQMRWSSATADHFARWADEHSIPIP